MSKQTLSAELRLLAFLNKHEFLSSEAADAAHAALGSVPPGRSGLDKLIESAQINEDEMARALAAQLRLPFVNLAAYPLDPQVTSLVRQELASRHSLVPLRLQDEALVVAAVNPLDREGLHAIQFATGRSVRPEVASLTAVRDAIDHAYNLDEALSAYLDGVPGETDVPVTELTEEANTDLSTLIRGSTLPPVVKLMNLILVDGIRYAASDIHIETSLSEVRVRYRIDGVLQEAFRLPKWVQDPLTARCKVLASLDITERRVPQDGRIRIRYREAMIDLRVSSLPTQFGEKVTMRILDPTAGPKGLDSLHLQPRDLACLREAINRPQGMILITGPTGSGKTTTLYAMIAELISPTRNIVTIENPIEYQIRGVNQVEINEKQGLTFAGTLRSVLRQDPDIILVGEIRDAETADIAVRASQTGHLVLSTVHTNDSVSTVYRLLDLDIDPYLIASSLHAVVAQRLVRRVCERCAEPYQPDPLALRALQLPDADPNYRRGAGCSACRKLGYMGREAILEVLSITPALAKLIEVRAPESTLRIQAAEDGMVLLATNATAKVLGGMTTVEEVLRVINVSEGRTRCAACDHVVEDTFAVCPNCSTPLRYQCDSCGKRMQKEWQTCPYCGTPSQRGAAAQAAASEAKSGCASHDAPSMQPSSNPSLNADPTPVHIPPDTPDPTRRYRTLVIDDERDFRHLMRMFLERSGMPLDVDAVGSGPEALEYLKGTAPHLILLDIMMPEMDGFEVCKRLRADVRTTFIPILMLTALDQPADRTRGFLAGTDDYVSKPFDRQELLARVRRVLQRTYGYTETPETTAAPPPSLQPSDGRCDPALAANILSSGH